MTSWLADHDHLEHLGGPVGRAVVTSVWGSAPRAPGAMLLAAQSGDLAGSVSGGCVESAAALAVQTAQETGAVQVVRYGVSDEDAWSVGLSCGGTIELLIEPEVRPQLRELVAVGRGAVLATRLDDDALGTAWLFDEAGGTQGPLAPVGSADGTLAQEPAPPAGLSEAAGAALSADASATVQLGEEPGSRFFLEVHARPAVLVLFGAGPVAEALAELARPLDFRVVVVDPRTALLDSPRLRRVERIEAWPGEALANLSLDARSFVCVLSHDPKLDDPALCGALASEAAYVGALGSRRTQAARRARLIEAGVDTARLERLRSPIGLDLGGKAPAEVALSILAEIVAVRRRGPAAS